MSTGFELLECAIRKECWFHQHGGCRKGSQCDMAHVGPVEVNMALQQDAMDRAVDARIEQWLKAAEAGKPQVVLNCIKTKPPVTAANHVVSQWHWSSHLCVASSRAEHHVLPSRSLQREEAGAL